MAWTFFKIACRLYAGCTAGVLLAMVMGEALTGGIRVEPTMAHMMKPSDAATLVLWLVAIIVSAVTSKSED